MATQVTKVSLPKFEQLSESLLAIWEQGWVTNGGPMVENFECLFSEKLQTHPMKAYNNGTSALALLLRAHSLKGEVITSPFTHIGTASAIQLAGLQPRFSDICSATLNVSPTLLESMVNENTAAILVPHIYGNPCDIESLQRIAKKYSIPLLFDGSHSVGVRYRGSSLLNYGDGTAFSLHATKVLHAIEGGGIVSANKALLEKASIISNFGIKSPEEIVCVGMNAKLSELHAAVGKLMLDQIDFLMAKRLLLVEEYDKHLRNRDGIRLPKFSPEVDRPVGYYPIIFDNEKMVLKTLENLEAEQIFPRRYFMPSLSELKFLSADPCPVSESISRRVLCLPLSAEYDSLLAHRVCAQIEKVLKRSRTSSLVSPARASL